MILLGLCSTYKEGRLSRMAIESTVRACDDVLVFDGPAGEALPDELADSELPDGFPRENVKTGSWATDAAKRTAIVKATRDKKRYGRGPVWAVWVDGDEILINGEYLRDLLQAVLWKDEQEGGEPTAGYPIRLVEMDGSVAVCRAKVLRVDLVDSYVVSSSGIRFKTGVVMAEGNLPMQSAEWWGPERMKLLVDEGRYLLAPPLPGEPFLLHRSPLRHPDRRKVRLHEQEARELERLGLWTP